MEKLKNDNNKFGSESILVILLSLMLNANVVRYTFNLSENSIALDGVLVLCVMVGLYNVRDTIALKEFYKVCMFAVPICVYGLLSIICLESDGIITVFKLIYLFLIYIIGMSVPYRIITKILLYTVVVNLLYTSFIIAMPEKAMEYLFQGEANYLNLTLTLGLSLTISLVYSVCNYFSYSGILRSILGLIVTSIFFLACSAFMARGTVLFPVLIAFIITSIIGIRKKVKGLVAFFILLFIISIATTYYLNSATDMAVSRMDRLFNDTEDESRVSIWLEALSVIFNNGWFILGGGVNAFTMYLGGYPHNIFLQFLGEYGFWGLIFISCIVYKSIREFYISNTMIRIKKRFSLDDMTVYITFSGMLYFLFTLSKSFSCYDAYTLFFMLGAVLKTSRYSVEENK